MKPITKFETFTNEMLADIKTSLSETCFPLTFKEQFLGFEANQIILIQPTSPEKSEYIPTGILLDIINEVLRINEGLNPHEIEIIQTDEYKKEKTITIETVKITINSTTPF